MEKGIQLSDVLLDFDYEKKFRDKGNSLRISHAESLWNKFCGTLSQNDMVEVNKVRIFAENLDYTHIGLKSNEYFLHPLRVGAIAGLTSLSKSVLISTIGLLHNVYEVTSVSQSEISKSFGSYVNEAVFKLKINRGLQSNNSYLIEYYSEIKSLPFNLGMIKVVDKIDNLYSLDSTATLSQKSKYLDEIKNFVIPLCDSVSPHLSVTLRSIAAHLELK